MIDQSIARQHEPNVKMAKVDNILVGYRDGRYSPANDTWSSLANGTWSVMADGRYVWSRMSAPFS